MKVFAIIMAVLFSLFNVSSTYTSPCHASLDHDYPLTCSDEDSPEKDDTINIYYVDNDKLEAEFGASEETLALPTYELLDEFIRSRCFFSAATSLPWEFHRDHLDSYFRAYDAFRELISRGDLIPALDKYASEHKKGGNDPDRMLFLFMIKQSDIKKAIAEVPDLSERYPALSAFVPHGA